jgi:hypothetical protein
MAEKKQKISGEQVIYIGPSLGRGRLLANTVFRGGVPEHLKDLRENYPELDNLMVPVAEHMTRVARIKQPGTAEQLAFKALEGGNANGI